MTDFNSIDDIQAALRKGSTTCRQLVERYLFQIEKMRHLNAFVEVFADEALARANALDARFQQNPQSVGRLFGAVLSLKDNICYAGHRVSAASKILENFTSIYSATAVERLLAEDAILIGRTNCDQFGMGSSNENSVYGPVRNAADPERVSGGSSGGAAVSVQADCCLAAIGSDTGGSVRQPAAFCGVWGLKPSYGRVSRHGLIAYGSSFDQIGALAKHPRDLAQLLQVMAGPDEFDATAAHRSADFFSEKTDSQQVRSIAWFPEALESPGLDPAIRDAAFSFLEKMRSVGHRTEAVSFDLLDYVIPAYYVLTTAEASANLARYDGIRYGYRSPNAQNLEETYVLSRSEGFSEEVKRRILLGTFVLSSGYYDAYFQKAQQARRLIRDRIFQIFENFDFILLPAAPTVAWRFGEKSDDPVAMYLSDVFTVLANLAGVPALAFPAGSHPENGMPIGLQLMAGMWQEVKLLELDRQLPGIF